MSSFLVLCEGDTRNRWRDGQVCPDVRQGTMAPWARRLGRGKEGRKSRKRTDGWRRERGDGKGEGKRVGERQRGARLFGRGSGCFPKDRFVTLNPFQVSSVPLDIPPPPLA
ncbi:hypothetical protein TNCV_1509861 [Trichonephila clavipes]|nr:hypothetical protein TNCV_1509861 [Trichonephila clavipes]